MEQVAAYNLLDEKDRKATPKPDAGEYRNSDVLDAFDRDFYSKCYLTEEKHPNSYSLEVEHFKSKAFSQSPELKYEWTNLFPCTHDANILKPKKDPDGGYLDPCDATDDVEKEIVYSLEFGGKSYFEPLNEQNVKARNTSKLLDKIHNGIDYNSGKRAERLQHLIAKKEHELIKLISKWQFEENLEEKARTSSKIKNILSRKSDFTMLLRSIDSVKYLPKDFLD